MAMGANLEMNSWLEAAQAGMMEQARKSCSLVMYDAENKPVARYYLENAWPTKCITEPAASRWQRGPAAGMAR